ALDVWPSRWAWVCRSISPGVRSRPRTSSTWPAPAGDSRSPTAATRPPAMATSSGPSIPRAGSISRPPARTRSHARAVPSIITVLLLHLGRRPLQVGELEVLGAGRRRGRHLADRAQDVEHAIDGLFGWHQLPAQQDPLIVVEQLHVVDEWLRARRLELAGQQRDQLVPALGVGRMVKP